MHVSDNNASYVQLASYHVCGDMCCSTQLMDLPAFLAQLRTLYSMDDATACNGRRRPDDVETYNNVICFVVSGSYYTILYGTIV